MTKKLWCEAVPVDRISSHHLKAMYALFEQCYDEITYQRFEEDFSKKEFVLLLRDRDANQIQGFSTQQVEEWKLGGKEIRTIFSGDTIIHPDYWGEQELVKGWCGHASWVRGMDPEKPLYWLLISKGYRTYLYLSLFCRRFYPHYQSEETDLKHIVAVVAREKFGDAFCVDRGVLTFSTSQGQLKPEYAGIPSNRKRHPHVAHFLKRNPGFASGDELVCLAELSDPNLRSYAARFFQQPRAPLAFC